MLQASSRPGNLAIRSVKYLNESDFDAKKHLAPQNPAENNEKQTSKSEQNFNFFGVEKSKFANRPKRMLPNFRGDWSHVQGVNGRSKFRAIYSFEPSIGCRRYSLCNVCIINKGDPTMNKYFGVANTRKT